MYGSARAREPGGVDARRVALGIAILLADRMQTDLGMRGARAPGTAGAFAIGATTTGLDLAGRAVRSGREAAVGPVNSIAGMGRFLARQPIAERVLKPARRVADSVAEGMRSTVRRGQVIAGSARADAVTFLELETSNGIAWLRTAVVPVVIDDLVDSPKVRELAVSQAHGALNDTARVLRARSADADGRLEAGIRRLFNARRHELAP
jgi:hypothetical protein